MVAIAIAPTATIPTNESIDKGAPEYEDWVNYDSLIPLESEKLFFSATFRRNSPLQDVRWLLFFLTFLYFYKTIMHAS